jgi:hypothetical protein
MKLTITKTREQYVWSWERSPGEPNSRVQGAAGTSPSFIEACRVAGNSILAHYEGDAPLVGPGAWPKCSRCGMSTYGVRVMIEDDGRVHCLDGCGIPQNRVQAKQKQGDE